VTRNPLSALAMVVATLLSGTSAIAAGQESFQPPVEPGPQATFRSSVEVVTVSATVRDARGRVIKDLKRTDFEVLDSGTPREIRDFYPGDAAVSLAVMLDISGSMAVGGNMDRARQAIKLALGQLQTGRDEAALFTFDDELQQVRAFTSDLKRVTSVSLAGKPWGKTSLYDAIEKTARAVGERTNRHRGVLVVTDGVDTGSRRTADEVSAVASMIDVPIYLVVVANPVDNPENDLAVIEADGASTEAATLADLARWTGGDMAIVSELEDSVAALGTLMGQLRHQYLITFEPGAQAGWHPLEIRTRKKHLTVRARSGYMAERIGSVR
jgi:Ca-activated chloride channel homolog